ncbi:3'(2'),5'-bisphosphate nucleotidase CysQ [Ahrensia sp. R2A130]|uniref:3'(2'),5'-bisphosphate nucleotidase CysQ n=1 Tax=Ahrensia sp. R2A130 TaxID=744979 RepID=UPI0001E09440|nr:3'(2'),5'-bisphosphate nucleotidase CysQ [Ahrensia sp. R2A130]EFL89571.1 3'(2'),5'-bisphosphate nucleotidase [Ahrensia sp. R2A130]
MIDESRLYDVLPQLCADAGHVIMDVRETCFQVEAKGDDSPVTLADTRAEAIVLNGLATAFPDIPVIAEEAMAAGQRPDTSDGIFFLVDPLDGTREFVDGFDDFTVNIALILDGVPMAGCVAAPAHGMLWYGSGSRLLTRVINRRQEHSTTGEEQMVVRSSKQTETLRVAVSRAHGNATTENWISQLGAVERAAVGSSLKFCWLAEGRCDVYPRFSPTMEWDTAAGDAILRAAGGQVLGPDGTALIYNDRQRETPRPFENPNFVAMAPGVTLSFDDGLQLG